MTNSFQDLPRSGPSTLHPSRLSAEERLSEVAALLAAGLIRLRLRKSSFLSAGAGESSVDFSGCQSGHAVHASDMEVAR